MHAKPDLRVLLEWMIAGSGSVITDVITLGFSMAIFSCPECEHSQDVAGKHVGKKTKCPKCGTRAVVQESVSLSVPDLETPRNNGAPVILRDNGGSIQTILGHGIRLNKESTLEREFITVIDPTMPAGLTGCVGIRTVYERETDYRSDQYIYASTFSVKALQDITAFEVRFLLFNIWGRHVQSLTSTEIADVPAGTIRNCDGKWLLYGENEACEHYASIAYTATIRTAAGQVYEMDPTPVLEEAKKFSSKFTDTDLEPTPIKR